MRERSGCGKEGWTEKQDAGFREVLHPVCWVSLVRGQTQESQSIWSPFACVDQSGRGVMEPVARGESDAPGRTRGAPQSSLLNSSPGRRKPTVNTLEGRAPCNANTCTLTGRRGKHELREQVCDETLSEAANRHWELIRIDSDSSVYMPQNQSRERS